MSVTTYYNARDLARPWTVTVRRGDRVETRRFPEHEEAEARAYALAAELERFETGQRPPA